MSDHPVLYGIHYVLSIEVNNQTIKKSKNGRIKQKQKYKLD